MEWNMEEIENEGLYRVRMGVKLGFMRLRKLMHGIKIWKRWRMKACIGYLIILECHGIERRWEKWSTTCN